MKRAKLKQHKILPNLFVLILLSGCAQEIITPTDSPTLGITPTVQSLQVPANTLTSEISNVFTIHSFCPEINHDASLLSSLTGTIVLGGDKISLGGQDYSPDENGSSVLLFWDTESNKKTVYQLPENQEYYYYLISPDKKSLALTEGKTSAQTSKVFVLTAHGQK